MRQGVDGNPEVRKVTYKNGVLSKIDLASRFPKGPKKTTEKRRISGFSRSFEVFCELRVLLRIFRSISVSVLNICH